MRAYLIASALLLASCSDDANVYTLYMSEGAEARKHVATFDKNGPEVENRSNCHQTGEILSRNAQERYRYWCERGRYRA